MRSRIPPVGPAVFSNIFAVGCVACILKSLLNRAKREPISCPPLNSRQKVFTPPGQSVRKTSPGKKELSADGFTGVKKLVLI